METKKDKHRCEAKVSDTKGWHYHQCYKNAVVERDGKWYCKIHDPEYIKAKRDAERAEYEIEKAKLKAGRIAIDQCVAINPSNPQVVAENIQNMAVRLSNLVNTLETAIQYEHIKFNKNSIRFDVCNSLTSAKQLLIKIERVLK